MAIKAMTRGTRWLLLLAVLLAVLLPLARTQDEESSQAEAVPAPRPLPRPPSSSAGPTTFAVAEPARQMEQGPLDGRGLRRYRRAAVLTAAAVRDLALTRATVFVCWGSEEAFLYRLLSSAGVAVQFLRGAERTRASSMRDTLSEGIYGTAVILDAACPFAERLLEMASRLRLFHILNTWIILEDGELLPGPPGLATDSDDFDDDFTDAFNVTVNRFGAQEREDADDPNEPPFLEVFAPVPSRTRQGLLQPDTTRLSASGLRLLDNKIIYLDSLVLWVQVSEEGHTEALEVFRSSRVRPLQAYLAAEAADDAEVAEVAEPEVGPHWRWLTDGPRQSLMRERRQDLQGATLRGSTIIKFPEEYTHIEDNSLRQNDLYPKMNWATTQNLAYTMNFGMLVYKRDNYGWEVRPGEFDGMVGELQRYEHDMLATAVFMRADRMRFIEAAGETLLARTAVMFRQPSKSSVSNVYLLPFSSGVWYSTVAVSALALALLVLQTQWWRRHPHVMAGEEADPGDHLEVGDCITFIIGALSQQGFHCTPAMVSARITIITTFIANLFLFTSFSGSIVAIIQSPSNAIRTVHDLLHSELQMGVHELPYEHVWFREAVEEDDVAGKLFKKKIKTHQPPGFVYARTGIKLVRAGGYAFQVELNEGYKEISDTFTESEKCDLAEMQLFPPATMVFATTKKSPYREYVTRSLRWQRETGLLDRLHHRWESEKPPCTSNVKNFVPIGLQEFYPALIVLYNGVLLSVAVLCAEQVYSSRALASCVQRCMDRRRGSRGPLSRVPLVAAAAY